MSAKINVAEDLESIDPFDYMFDEEALEGITSL